MKKIVLAATAIALLSACTSTQSSESTGSSASPAEAAAPADLAGAPVMKFEEEQYDFGTITTGQKVSYEFKFKNTGKTPLIISDAQATCGCTVPDYPREPVAPGAEGTIKVIFDSSGKLGMQNKVVTIISNAVPATSELHLIGDIKEAK